jgi:methylamine dehydrogenase accessory protein MauD
MNGTAVSMFLLWVGLVVLSLTVLALARQIGVLHARIAPIGALKMDHGPAVGQPAPRFEGRTLDGRAVVIGGVLPARTAQLLLFVSPDCPVCKMLLPVAVSFARSERLDVVLVGDGPETQQRELVSRLHLEPVPFVNSAEIGLRFGVGKLPYAVLLDAQGVVAAKGLVNSREHLESLVVAHETGLPSVQAYLRQHTA